MRPVYGLFILLLTAFPAWAAMSNDTLSTQTDLTELSLEALMDIEVTSVSKRPQRLFESAAAVFVITGEDIRRSGARSIPEALRLAPGISVAQIDANKWAITSRGFNSRFSDMGFDNYENLCFPMPRKVEHGSAIAMSIQLLLRSSPATPKANMN